MNCMHKYVQNLSYIKVQKTTVDQCNECIVKKYIIKILIKIKIIFKNMIRIAKNIKIFKW